MTFKKYGDAISPNNDFVLEQLMAYSAEEVNALVQATKPHEWGFSFELTDMYRASFTDKEGKTLWVGQHWDEKNLLLTAFGWLHKELYGGPTHPMWTKRTDFPKVVPGPISQAPDPEDLNPTEELLKAPEK